MSTDKQSEALEPRGCPTPGACSALQHISVLESFLDEKRTLLVRMGDEIGDGSLNASSGLWTQLLDERDALRSELAEAKAVAADNNIRWEQEIAALLEAAVAREEALVTPEQLAHESQKWGEAAHRSNEVVAALRSELARVREFVREVIADVDAAHTEAGCTHAPGVFDDECRTLIQPHMKELRALSAAPKEGE